MNINVGDLMVPNVLTASPQETVGIVRKRILKKHVHCLPVVDAEHHPVGIISTSDLVDSVADDTPVSEIMTEKVYSVPQYDDVHIAARVMRNHGIHHVIVTHEKKVSGILSTFDLLQLVEDHRFVMKNPPPESKRHAGKQRA